MTPDTLIKEQGKYPVLTANKAFVLGYTDDSQKVQNDIPRIVFDDFTMDSKFADFPFSVRSSAIKLLSPRYKDNLYFLYLLINTLHFPELGHARHYISYVQSRRIRIPSTSEQSAIANFFHVLDSLISAAKRQRDLLKDQKQAYLQLMFPKNGQDSDSLSSLMIGNDDGLEISLNRLKQRIQVHQSKRH